MTDTTDQSTGAPECNRGHLERGTGAVCARCAIDKEYMKRYGVGSCGS